MNLEELLAGITEIAVDRETWAAAIARVAVLEPADIDADDLIASLKANNESIDTAFWAGAAEMLAAVKTALREPLAVDGG